MLPQKGSSLSRVMAPAAAVAPRHQGWTPRMAPTPLLRGIIGPEEMWVYINEGTSYEKLYGLSSDLSVTAA